MLYAENRNQHPPLKSLPYSIRIHSVLQNPILILITIPPTFANKRD
jgi:hypothetical protein